ncbi:SufD family Fe-S cluster assembly protein [Candidatus Gottesmanbacteria bacterium]|nr:SufD family Fe-S cluster assembly protein [Candidatus Gottesmanbacteria bacterium]
MEKRDSDTIVINSLEKDQKFSVNEGEKKTFVIVLTDGKNSEGDVKIFISGRNADVQILGLIVGYGKQHVRLYTFQDHVEPESVSDLLIKSVLFDEAKVYYSGLIRIEKDAQKSNAYQKNQTLLMSPNSWADTRPTLEIEANDVRCTHGATIGKLREDEMYYLETRGLTQKDASRVLIKGFYQDVLRRIPNDNIRKDIESKLYSQLHALV